MLKEKLSPKTILVIGDLMLDSYYIGSVKRISPEAPVPVFLKKSKRSVVGGAANVAANLIAAGQTVHIASILGDDSSGTKIINYLSEMGCNVSAVTQSKDRKTTVKTRLLAENNQQMLRIDEERTNELNEEDTDRLLKAVEKQIGQADAVILSDYLKGVLTQTVCKKITEMASLHNIRVFVDPKDISVEKYSGAFLIKPNKKELAELTGMPVDNKEQICNAAKALREYTHSQYVMVTLGADGMGLFGENEEEFIGGEPRDVFDVSGAGDTAISYLTACCVNGLTVIESTKVANVASGIKVGKVGTATVSLDEVELTIVESQNKTTDEAESKKIVHADELVKILNNKVQKKVVFTNGCFDILHAGHVMYLKEAAKFGDILVVGVNSDESVRRLKGNSRPINPIADRTAVLAGLESITYIVVFDEDTPETLIRKIRPDILVKGADYSEDQVVGAQFVKERGGEVKLVPLLDNRSTTNIIRKSGGEK